MISPVKIWRRQKKIRQFLGKVGEVTTWTKIYVAGSDFKNSAPYIVILVDLGREKILVQLADEKEAKNLIGSRVKICLRRIRQIGQEDIIPYGLKAKLIKS
jgi:uncharacterized OB-fold protein